MKTRHRKRTQSGCKGAAQTTGRAKARTPEPKRRKPDASVSPQKNFERYMALARDAASSGDAIQSENYYQHAEHYLRLMAST